MRKTRLWFSLYTFFVIFQTIQAVDFDDIKEKQGQAYGSEKDKRYVIDAFFIEWESWPRKNPTYNSFHLFWLFNSTNYPKYEKTQFFPFYYSQSSKVDERYEANHLLLSHYGQESKDSYSYRFFPLLWVGNQKGYSYQGVLPLYFKSNRDTLDKKQDLIIFPGFYQNNVRYPKANQEEQISISPFHVYSFIKSPKDEITSFWFPILPLYYSSSDRVEIHKNYLWFIDIKSDPKKDILSQVWILPFVFWKRDSYLNVFPIYFKEVSKDEKSGSWYGIFPPSYYNYSPDQSTFYLLNYFTSSKKVNELSENFTTFAPLYFNWNNNKGYSETLAPLFWYSETKEDSSSHKNILLLYDHSYDNKGFLDRLFTVPLFFYKRDSYLHILPPFYWSWYLDDYNKDIKVKERNSHTLALPLFYRQKNQDNSGFISILGIINRNYNSNDEATESLLLPFYYYKKDSYFHIAPFYFSTASKDKISSSWFGIIPPIYYSTSPSHKTFYLLNYYTGSDTTKDSSEGFTTFAPLYFNWSNNKGYSRTLIPAIYYSHTREDTSTYKNILLLYSHVFDNKGSLNKLFVAPVFFYEKDSYLHVAPFYWSWATTSYNSTSKTTEKNDRTFAFPIYYREKNADTSTYTNVLGFVSREHDENGKLTGSMYAPFYFYKRNSYDIVFPFSFKFGPDEESKELGTRWGLMYYSHWNPKEETLWIANWYSSKDKVNDTYFKSLSPIYYNWKTKNSSGEVSPLFVTVKFPNKDRFHVNLSGYSSNVASGFLKPDVILAVGEKDGYKYIDSDVSWLWYVFRMSNRTSTKAFYDIGEVATNLLNNNESIPDPKEVTPVSSPKIAKRKSFTRDESIQFFGVNILFGLFGWEAGDSKRHIRAFPLAWFTWDSKSDDKVYTIPPLFVNYYSEDVRYTVLFPFYGYQKTPEAERTAYGLFGYISESVKENRSEEKSVLWPLANWHSSDIKSGHRILPFYWYRNRKEGRDNISTLISPLFYYNNTLDRKGTEDAYVLSPLWFRFYTRQSDESFDRHFAIPFYFYSQNNTKYEKSKLFLSLPFTYYRVSDTHGNSVYDKTFWMIPILALYNSDNFIKNWNAMLIANSIETKDNSNFIFFPVYYHDIDYDGKKETSITRFVLPSYYKKDYAKQITDTETVKLYSPIFLYHSYKNKSTVQDDKYWFAPIPFLYHSYELSINKTYWNFLIINSYENSDVVNELIILPVYNHELKYDQEKLISISRFVFPGYYKKDYAKQITDTETVKLYSPIFLYHSYKNKSTVQDDKYWFAPIPFLYHSYETANDRYYWNWLFFASYENSNSVNDLKVIPFYYHDLNYEKEKLTSVTRWAFPVYYEKNYAKQITDAETVKLYLPLLFFHSYKNKSFAQDDKYWFAPIPLLFHSYETINHRSYWNWFLFASYENSDTSHDLKIFPIFYQDFYEQDSKNFNYTNWLFPVYYWNKNKTTKTVASIDNEESKEISDSSTSIYSLLGIYSNKNDRDKFWFITPVLLYHSNTPEESYYNWLLFVSREKTKSKSIIQILPFYSWSSIQEEKDKRDENMTWLFPFYYYSNNKNNKIVTSSDGESKEIRESEIFTLTPLGFYNNQNDMNKKWFFAGLYHSGTETENYYNLLLFLISDNSKLKNSNTLFPFFHKSISYRTDGKINQSNYWSFVLPFWFNREYSTEKNPGETSILSLPFYLNYKYKNEDSENHHLNLWLIPLIFNYQIDKDESSWSWLFFVSSYKGQKDKTSLSLFPITGFDFDKKNKDIDLSTIWVMPLFYYKKEDNRIANRFDKSFFSILYNEYETEVKTDQTKSYERSILFPIVPFIFYKNTTLEDEHTNVLVLLDYAKEKEVLTRFILFPYWYSLNFDDPNNPKKYRHFFPVYFSTESNTEYSSFVAGVYWSSDAKGTMQNFFMLAEHQYVAKTDKREMDFLLRSIHFESTKDEFRFRLLYGLGDYRSIPQATEMNLLWLSYQNKKDYTYNNVLPFYYLENKKSDKKLWITPALYYSKNNERENFQYAGLGTLYYSNSDFTKKEDHMNLLMGILYYKTSIPKERGYQGMGSLWGMLWEYKTESETKYSKFSILKFVYSNTTDETGESYQRILGVRF